MPAPPPLPERRPGGEAEGPGRQGSGAAARPRPGCRRGGEEPAAAGGRGGGGAEQAEEAGGRRGRHLVARRGGKVHGDSRTGLRRLRSALPAHC